MKKRWICLFVENEIGVLARVSGLFSGKSYNLDSLTVGVTEDNNISRMTISLTSDDKTFEQIKKQLNRSIEVIKVVDYTDVPIFLKEILFAKITECSNEDKAKIFRISQEFSSEIIECNYGSIILECNNTESKNNELIILLRDMFINRLEIVRGGSVAIERMDIY